MQDGAALTRRRLILLMRNGHMMRSTEIPDPQDLPTREGYDRWAEIYDGEDNPLIMLEEDRIQSLLGDVHGLDLADIGCGTGRHTLPLATAGARVTAVDFSEGMLAAARAKPGADGIKFIAHDLETPLPLETAAFDRVTCFLVLDHIQRLDVLFSEFHRICRPDGCVVISSMHPAMMLLGVTARFTDPNTGRKVRPASVPNQICDYVMAAVRAGLTIDHMSEYPIDEATAARSPRAEKYLGWPILLLMRLRPQKRPR